MTAMANREYTWFNRKLVPFLKSIGNGFESWFGSATGQTLSNAQKEANQFSADEAQKNREFQQQMSDTAYQREVADMQAAGLNPQLMYRGSASGASTPSGASPSSVDAGQPSLNPLGLLAQIQQLSLLKAQKDNIKADTEKKKQDVSESSVRIDMLRANTAKLIKDIDLMDANIHKLGLESDALEIANKYIAAEKEMSLYVSGLNADKIVAETAEVNKRIEKLDKEQLQILQNIAESKAKVNYLLAQTSLTNEQKKLIPELINKTQAETKVLLEKGVILQKDINWYTHDKIVGDVGTAGNVVGNVLNPFRGLFGKGSKGVTPSRSFIDADSYLD